MNKKSFILYNDSLGILDELTDEQAGQLFKLIYQYNNPNKPKITQITQMVNLAFYPFKTQFDRDLQSYSNVVERNKKNGSLGGRPKIKNPNKPKKADKDTDTDIDKDTDKYIVDIGSGNVKFPTDDIKFIAEWTRWKKYKEAHHKFKYKSVDSEQTAINMLWDMGNKTPTNCMKIINQSIANGWKGFVELKENLIKQSNARVSLVAKEDNEW